MKTVSFQGIKLSPAQRQRLEIERRFKAALVTPLQQQVNETLQVLESRKEQGAKPEKVWFLLR
ncbi:hypothetical protein [Azotobacter chroococcum]|uniref:hypothetical protein n=1 Tax=Azotobacter chroococcum TaxID=353 RepID=UPI0010AECB13|nr:hypothetical protein [Azotobacter chroococcum]TKD46229.1 hypothetical protein FCG41_02400 [Azotobacter chroococcum]